MSTKAEQESIFRYAADETTVHIWTAHPPTQRKIERAGYQPIKSRTQAGKASGWFYTIPLAEFRWRLGRRRKVSDAQREAAKVRFAASRMRFNPSSPDKIRGSEEENPRE
jgi:hypothetical protein